MIYLLIALFIFYIVFLFKNSKSDYFNQHKHILFNNLDYKIFILLADYGFSDFRIAIIEKAYNYFIETPKEFDGATIVKDITQIKNLDIPAMVHDYNYIFAKGIKDRLKADWNYSQDMRKFDIAWTTAYSRMALLFIINITGLYYISTLFQK